jgi:hypothetical protein
MRGKISVPHLLLLSAAVAARLNRRGTLLLRRLLRPRLLRLRVSVGGRLLRRLALRAGEGGLLRARFRRRQLAAGPGRAALEQRKDIHWSTSQRIGRSGVIPACGEAPKDS